MTDHTNTTINISVSQYRMIADILYEDDGSFIQGINGVDCPAGCFGPIVVYGETDTISLITELLDDCHT